MTVVRDIRSAQFRANPDYELVSFERLTSSEQASFAGHSDDPDFFGILRPRDSNGGLGIKVVDPDTALLFMVLNEPGRIPAYVVARLKEACDGTLAELVLDNVLQIEQNGGFASGAAGYESIYGRASSGPPQGRLARLSLDAVKYAQELRVETAAQLSTRMYLYNRIPASVRLRRELPDSRAVMRRLGTENGLARTLLEKHWRAEGIPPPNDAWFVWRNRDQEVPAETTDVTYKLYVSPRPEALPEAFSRAVEVLSERRAPVFKVGKDVHGILRPDKMVAYFWGRDHMLETAESLLRALTGFPAQGVPFTAELGLDGMVSWGVDPPQTRFSSIWEERESWRLWVTNRLAAALLSAMRSGGLSIAPWEFALERIRLEGVDTATWAPEGSPFTA